MKRSRQVQILTGDIGGTNTRLALVRYQGSVPHVEQEMRFPSTAYASLTEIINAFKPLQACPALTAAAFGVAGPVSDGLSRITNLPWIVSARELAQRLGIEAVYLMNDLEALAWGIDTLDDEELVSLHSGEPDARGNRAVIAAGTGLGEAGLYLDDGTYKPFATEGGHADFAPSTDQDWLLHGFLGDKYGHVSWERVVSGQGLVHLCEFLLKQSGAPAPDWFADPERDTAALITEKGLSGSEELCSASLDWFVRLYGAEAGNLALKMKATGGVYLGGGIAPKMLPALQNGAFIDAFLNKGRMSGLLESTPVQVICNDQVALQGLAHFAAMRV
jgi:glucokinase